MNYDLDGLKDLILVAKLLNEKTNTEFKESKEDLNFDLTGCRVIVRSRNAGVMYGTLVSVSGQHVKLKNARMIWGFYNINGGLCTNDLAKEGVDEGSGSKLSAIVDELEMLEACTVLKASKKAIEKLDNYPVHTKKED